MICIDIPPWIDEMTRQSMVSYICSNTPNSTPLKTLHAHITKEETFSLLRLISVSPNLTDVQERSN